MRTSTDLNILSRQAVARDKFMFQGTVTTPSGSTYLVSGLYVVLGLQKPQDDSRFIPPKPPVYDALSESPLIDALETTGLALLQHPSSLDKARLLKDTLKDMRRDLLWIADQNDLNFKGFLILKDAQGNANIWNNLIEIIPIRDHLKIILNISLDVLDLLGRLKKHANLLHLM